MTEDKKIRETIPRRKFLVGAGLAGTAAAAGLAQSAPAQAQTAAPAAAAQTAPQDEPLLILNETEHAFVVAAIDTLIPADELSPSGSDCGCAVYIDRQLASAWGGGAKSYRAGPYIKGKPEQGYQLPLTPAEFMSAGIAAANVWSRKTYGHDFDRLDPDKRIEALKEMQEGKAEFVNFSSRAFFARLLTMTMEGFLRRSDLWRQPQQGLVAHAGLSRPARDLRQCDRRVSRQALRRRAAIHRRFLVAGRTW